MPVSGIKSIILTSKNAEVLSEFYSRVLGVRFKKHEHDDVPPHWAAFTGNLVMVIHEAEAFERLTQVQSIDPTRVSFTVGDLESFSHELSKQGVDINGSKFEIGPMQFMSIMDPEGRPLYFGTPWKP